MLATGAWAQVIIVARSTQLLGALILATIAILDVGYHVHVIIFVYMTLMGLYPFAQIDCIAALASPM